MASSKTSKWGLASWPVPWGENFSAGSTPPPPPPTGVVLETPSAITFSSRPALEAALQASAAFLSGGASPAVGAWQPYVDFSVQILIQ